VEDTAAKSPRESEVVMTQLILPSDANNLNSAFGGKVMEWIDICGAVAAQRHCRQVVVTASMDDLHFHAPIRVGWIALLRSRVLAAFRTYLELLRPASELLDQVPDDPTVLSHLVAATAQLTTDERQLLLAAPDTTTRLRTELKLLNREAGLLARVRAVPVPLSDLARPASPN
jgi:hypothetical protein